MAGLARTGLLREGEETLLQTQLWAVQGASFDEPGVTGTSPGFRVSAPPPHPVPQQSFGSLWARGPCTPQQRGALTVETAAGTFMKIGTTPP